MYLNQIGEIIKQIRRDNNLTQQKLGDMLGVTYQAVSKWENGKNIPDIATLKLISEKFGVDLNELLTGNKTENVSKTKKIPKKYILIPFLIVFIIVLTYVALKSKSSYEFINLKSNNENFEVTGILAFSNDKTSVFISDIKPNFKDDSTYLILECILYEENGKSHTQISKCGDIFEGPRCEGTKLDELLKTVSFNVGDFTRTCKKFEHNHLYLEINALDTSKKTTNYKIPLTLEKQCQTKNSTSG